MMSLNVTNGFRIVIFIMDRINYESECMLMLYVVSDSHVLVCIHSNI